MNRRDFIQKAGSGAIAAAAMPYATRSVKNGAAKINVGFSRQSIKPCIESQTAFRRDLEAVCAVIGDKESQTVIVALDLLQLSPAECSEYRKEISEKVSLPEESILIHTTHTHSAPWDERFNSTQYGASRIVGLPGLISKLVIATMEKAKPAKIKYGIADVGQTLSVYRRGDAGPDLGYQTFWFGYQYHDGDDRPDASALVNEMRSRWQGKAPEYVAGDKPVWFDKPVDPNVQSIVFEDNNGHVIGSIVRFSAHPHLSSACAVKLYDPDFPGITRDVMEAKLGGTCMFLLGTTGNIVPKEKVEYRVVPEKSPVAPYLGPNWAFEPVDEKNLLDEMKRIGTDIANAAIRGLEKSKAEELKRAVHHPFASDILIDPALPASMEELESMKKALVPEYISFMRSGLPLSQMRLLANRLNWLEWAGKKSLGLLNDDDRRAGKKQMPLSVLQLNDINMAFMHSEISMETDMALHQKFPGLKIITVSMTGGSIEYIPTDAMLDEGGYEGRSAIVAYGTEGRLADIITEKIRSL